MCIFAIGVVWMLKLHVNATRGRKSAASVSVRRVSTDHVLGDSFGDANSHQKFPPENQRLPRLWPRC